MKVVIETIDHVDQRYDTVGDWTYEADGTLRIFVSNMGDDRYAFLVGVHEAIEAFLCKQKGITGAMVDIFDMGFKGEDEPGDDPKSPYFHQHQFATAIELQLAAALDVDWDVYDKTIELLGEKPNGHEATHERARITDSGYDQQSEGR